MLDITLIRNDPQQVEHALAKRDVRGAFPCWSAQACSCGTCPRAG